MCLVHVDTETALGTPRNQKACVRDVAISVMESRLQSKLPVTSSANSYGMVNERAKK